MGEQTNSIIIFLWKLVKCESNCVFRSCSVVIHSSVFKIWQNHKCGKCVVIFLKNWLFHKSNFTSNAFKASNSSGIKLSFPRSFLFKSLGCDVMAGKKTQIILPYFISEMPNSVILTLYKWRNFVTQIKHTFYLYWVTEHCRNKLCHHIHHLFLSRIPEIACGLGL